MPTLRMLCFNIHGGRSLDGQRDLNRIRALMDEYKIDIGIFQEMETRQSCGGREEDIEMLAGPNRPHIVCGPSMTEGKGWYGNLIVSAYPVIRSFNHNLETSPRLEPRGAVDALIDTGNGKIRLIGTHLSLRPRERWQEVRNLVKLIHEVEHEEPNPVFLMGDINEWRTTSRLLRFLNKTMVAVPCGRTFPSFKPVFKLDRIWHDRPGMKANARALETPHIRKLSDHLPVLIEAELIAS